MAVIPVAVLNLIREHLRAYSAEAQQQIMRALEDVDWSNVEDARDEIIKAMQYTLDFYTGIAAQEAADFYDAAREQCTGSALGAFALPGYKPAATEGAIRAFVDKIVKGGNVQAFNNLTLQRVDYEIKKAYGNCIVANGERDPLDIRYARVPSGTETCSFCIMLASRDFIYHTKESAGAVDHYHANCDCLVVPGFPGMEVEGYDPDAYYDQYLKDLEEGRLSKESLRQSAKNAKDKKKASSGKGRAVDTSYKAKWPYHEDRVSYLESSKDIEEFDKRTEEIINDMKQEYPNGEVFKGQMDSLRYSAYKIRERFLDRNK